MSSEVVNSGPTRSANNEYKAPTTYLRASVIWLVSWYCADSRRRSRRCRCSQKKAAHLAFNKRPRMLPTGRSVYSISLFISVSVIRQMGFIYGHRLKSRYCSHRGYLMSRSTISTFQRDVSRPGNREGLESRLGRTASAAPGGSRERITTRGRLLSLQSVQGFHRPHRHDFRAVACPAARGFMRCTRRQWPVCLVDAACQGVGVTQKTAWFILGRLREACGDSFGQAARIIVPTRPASAARGQQARERRTCRSRWSAHRRSRSESAAAHASRANEAKFDSDVFMMKFASTSSRRYDEFAVSLAGFSTKPSTTALEYVAMTLRRTASRMSLPCSSAASTARSTISPASASIRR